MDLRSSRQIVGTPFWLFIAPVCALNAYLNRKRAPLVREEDPVDTWVVVDLCFGCNKDAEHECRQYADDGCIETECMSCGYIA